MYILTFFRLTLNMSEILKSHLDIIFSTRNLLDGRNSNPNPNHFFSNPLCHYNEQIFFLFFLAFLHFLHFSEQQCSLHVNAVFQSIQPLTHRSKTAIHEREWLPASPSPTILMSTCGPLLNCAKLIPATEMSFTLAPVLKHTAEPLRGIRGVMELARVPEKS